MLFDAINVSIKIGRKYQHTDPQRAMDEIDKLALLSDILKTVTSFENKLVTELDVD